MPITTPLAQAGVRDPMPRWTATFTDTLDAWLVPRRGAISDGSYDRVYG